MTESEKTKNRMIDLSRMSYERGIYTYSDFLTLAEQSDFWEAAQSGKLYQNDYRLFGGIEGAERVMVRFGSEDSLGYDEPWPISIIKIEPLNRKFADALTHRDVLGSLMNLGIERNLLGDILINRAGGKKGNMPVEEKVVNGKAIEGKTTNGKTADRKTADSDKQEIYLFTQEHIADTLVKELTRIKHTSVIARIVEETDDIRLPEPEDMNLQVKSERTDLIIAHLYNLSRAQSAEMFAAKKVFVNGRLMENESHILRNGDIVSLRGYGRFIYRGVGGSTRKGNLNIVVSKFV